MTGVTVGESDIPYTIVRSKRRRRTVEIRVDPERGVLVTVPQRTSAAEIAELVRKRAGWIQRRSRELALRPLRKELVSGESIPYLGEAVPLLVQPAATGGLSVTLDPSGVSVLVPLDLVGDERRAVVANGLERWYRDRAAEHLATRVAQWSPVVGHEARAVFVRSQKRLWGSCGPDGTLRFNWRLVQLAPALIDYVVVHELSHLEVRNHSATFWAKVASVQSDYAERRLRLRREGALVVL